jgi:hypothetical protein
VKTIFVMVIYLLVGSFAGKLVSILADLAGGLGVITGSLGRPNIRAWGTVLVFLTLFS